MAEVEFFFYYGCPWTYLAFIRVQETAMRTSARIAWRPILVDRVKQQVAPGAGSGHAASSAARARYQVKDLADWARFCGVAITRPGPYPVGADWAARGAVVAVGAGLIVSYSQRVFAACFAAGADLADLEVAVRAARDAGMEPSAFRRDVTDPASMRLLEANSDELVARGGFGSPTLYVGDDLYFGNDRMPLVELALSQAADRPLVMPGAHGQG